MNAAEYDEWTRELRANTLAVHVLKLINEALKYLCYALYPLLLILAAIFNPGLVLRFVVVPAVLFIAVSLFRKAYNAPRPYEALDIDPLIYKNTKGKSFPSRHIFSIFTIAMCWLYYCIPVGIILMVCGVVMAAIRVLGGVHFPKDVIAGALIAIIGSAIGLWIFPWP